jgi:hypothetical protein
MLRKNLMICVTVFAAQLGVLVQTVFGILVALAALLLQLEKKPYKSDFLDLLETWSLICCIITLLLGIMLVASSLGNAPYSESLVTAISLMVVLLHACYILFWFINFVPQVKPSATTLMLLLSCLVTTVNIVRSGAGSEIVRGSRARLRMAAESAADEIAADGEGGNPPRVTVPCSLARTR